eukprot:365276-Chlamydomonas_euryale.AAC.21
MRTQRLDLMLVDYLLRRDNCGAAAALVARLPGRAGPQLTEAALFGSVRPIVAALSDLRDCGPALAWCAENRARLKRLKSKLEFKLRCAERGGRRRSCVRLKRLKSKLEFKLRCGASCVLGGGGEHRTPSAAQVKVRVQAQAWGKWERGRGEGRWGKMKRQTGTCVGGMWLGSCYSTRQRLMEGPCFSTDEPFPLLTSFLVHPQHPLLLTMNLFPSLPPSSSTYSTPSS